MPKPRFSRTFYFLLAWAFVLLGILGVLLPVLPTTPFMLLALWSFSRSSQRFHDWLYSHPAFGPPLQQWQRHRVIPLSAKLIASVTMAASLVYLFGYSGASGFLKWLALVLMAYGAYFIWTRPSHVAVPSEGHDRP